MTLIEMPFEVSWTAEKLQELPQLRGIDPFGAVLILNDARTKLVAASDPPYLGQERAIGLDAHGRLLTVAMTIEYPEGGLETEVGIIRCHTAWHSSRPERELFNAG